MSDEAKKNEVKEHKPPTWEIFLVGEDGEIIKEKWENKDSGKSGTSWKQFGALWENKSKTGNAFLSGSLNLASGEKLKLKLFRRVRG